MFSDSDEDNDNNDNNADESANKYGALATVDDDEDELEFAKIHNEKQKNDADTAEDAMDLTGNAPEQCDAVPSWLDQTSRSLDFHGNQTLEEDGRAKRERRPIERFKPRNGADPPFSCRTFVLSSHSSEEHLFSSKKIRHEHFYAANVYAQTSCEKIRHVSCFSI